MPTTTATARAATPRARDEADAALYESYRLHQKDVLRECVDDAQLLAKRALARLGADGAGLAVGELALTLFEKRCESWTEYRAARAAPRPEGA